MAMTSASHPSRQLGGFDATTVGIGSMIGAGVFVVFPPAAASAGSLLPLALLLAAVVAFCNAAATAQLAAIHPQSGGTYIYGRRQLGQWPGFIAGWSFITGKTASCAAIAYTLGIYLLPGNERAAAVAAVVVVTAINMMGITRTAWATRIIVSIVVAVLAFVLVVAFASPAVSTAPTISTSATGVLQAAGLLFFAFAGYARIATMGGEVHEPEKNIPRAVLGALCFTLGLYVLLALALTHSLGLDGLASSRAPLLAVFGTADDGVSTTAVTVAAVLACLGGLLALVAGIGRTIHAMASEGDLPAVVGRLGKRFHAPVVAEPLIAVIVIILILSTDVLTVVGFSSFGVLLYYAITNASALTLGKRPWYAPRALNVLGCIGCLLLAFTLPITSVLVMLAVLGVGVLGRVVKLSIQRN